MDPDRGDEERGDEEPGDDERGTGVRGAGVDARGEADGVAGRALTGRWVTRGITREGRPGALRGGGADEAIGSREGRRGSGLVVSFRSTSRGRPMRGPGGLTTVAPVSRMTSRPPAVATKLSASRRVANAPTRAPGRPPSSMRQTSKRPSLTVVPPWSPPIDSIVAGLGPNHD
ncbi:MAG TPA: hypothetical protein ENK57_24420 [Polyangiaceae bacterium]|nr:hypothetical protein [Polyangiaceae bacterium]